MTSRVEIINADCLDALPRLAAEGFRAHAVVTDPPYGLGFMGKAWDAADNVAFRPETWAAVRDCMLPGAHLLAFSGTRTSHRMVCAIEDAGFEIRDTLMWVYGSGFPKSLDVSKAIDRAAGAERINVVGTKLGRPGMARDGSNQSFDSSINTYGSGGLLSTDITAPATPEAAAWAGWGTALKPSYEPIILARKPLSEGNVAANVLRHGTGAINVDASRVGDEQTVTRRNGNSGGNGAFGRDERVFERVSPPGRWPANLLHDGSPEVEQAFAAFGDKPTGNLNRVNGSGDGYGIKGQDGIGHVGDTGSASRFFYTAKADANDRAGSRHPTVKPASLMRWLVRLVCPEGGTVLDPFAGTGSTGLAADQLGMNAVLIERDAQYAADARRKIAADAPLFASVALSEAAD